MAYITRRRGVFYLGRRLGKKKVVTSLRTTNRKEANRLLAEFEEDLVRGRSRFTSTPVGQVVDAYLSHVKMTVSEARWYGSLVMLRDLFGEISPGLSNESSHGWAVQRSSDRKSNLDNLYYHVEAPDFESITTRHLSEWFGNMIRARHWSSVTANHKRTVVVGLWRWAMKSYGLRPASGECPTDGLRRFKVQSKEIVYLSPVQVEQQFAALKNEPQLYAMVAVWIYAGLRLSEVLHLTVDDLVVQSEPSVKVRNSVNLLPNSDSSTPGKSATDAEPKLAGRTELHFMGSTPLVLSQFIAQPCYVLIRITAKAWPGGSWRPKTGKGRVVPVSSRLRAVLSQYRPPEGSRWLFPAPCGGLWAKSNFSRHFSAVQRRAGLKWGCLHFRHTFGSHLAQGNVSPFKIAKLMGNSEPVVRKHYAALISEDMMAEVELAGG